MQSYNPQSALCPGAAATSTFTFRDAADSGRVWRDALDRLTSAEGDDGSGPAVGVYADTYAYDPLGSLTSTDGRVYTYTGSGHAHAVRYAYGLGAGGRFDAFDTLAQGTWTPCDGGACGVYNDGGENVLRNHATGSGTQVARAAYALTDGDLVHVEFQLNGTTPQALLTLQAEDEQQSFGVVITQSQVVRAQWVIDKNEAYAPLVPALTLVPGRWYALRLGVARGPVRGVAVGA